MSRVRAILKEVAEQHGVTVEDIKGPSRGRFYSHPRFRAIQRLRAVTNSLGEPLSYPRIGQILGGRDHTTIMAGKRRGDELFGPYIPFTPANDPEETRL